MFSYFAETYGQKVNGKSVTEKKTTHNLFYLISDKDEQIALNNAYRFLDMALENYLAPNAFLQYVQ